MHQDSRARYASASTKTVEERLAALEAQMSSRRGPEGPQGPQGVPGPQGPAGRDGKDAQNIPVPGPAGRDGKDGTNGAAATIEIGATSAGDKAAVENVGNETHAVLNFTLPKPRDGRDGAPGVPGRDGIGIPGRDGKNGMDGKSATVRIGKVEIGDTASVVNVGTEHAAILNFVLPRGPQGEPSTVPGPQGEQGIEGPPINTAAIEVRLRGIWKHDIESAIRKLVSDLKVAHE